MNMIDVMKRLAELDSQNPNIVKESTVAECGMMPEMAMELGGAGQSSSPASINMTAGSGPELSGMLKDIMQLAGVQQHADPHSGMDAAPQPQVLEPVGADEQPDATTTMRSVIDKLNPMGSDSEGDHVDQAMGDIDNDGDHDIDDHELEKNDGEETDEEYDNTPADPTKPPPFSSNQFAKKENQPGQGDRMDGDRPKAYADMNEATLDLFAQYKKFVNEN